MMFIPGQRNIVDALTDAVGLGKLRVFIFLGVHGMMLGLAVAFGYEPRAIFFVLLAIELSLYAAVHTSDPGYIEIPSGTVGGEENEGLVELEWSRRAWKPGAGIDDRLPAAPPTLKVWCSICEVSPPLRSQHCDVCNRCVAQFEQHNFMCSCVGEKNRARYLAWVASTTAVLGTVLMDLLGSREWLYSTSLLTFISGNFGFIVAASVYWSFFVFFAFSLSVGLVLASANMTLYEVTRHRYKLPYFGGYGMCSLPFNRGICQNAAHFMRSDAMWRSRRPWAPEDVVPPGEPPEDVEVWDNFWENKYYSCC